MRLLLHSKMANQQQKVHALHVIQTCSELVKPRNIFTFFKNYQLGVIWNESYPEFVQVSILPFPYFQMIHAPHPLWYQSHSFYRLKC